MKLSIKLYTALLAGSLLYTSGLQAEKERIPTGIGIEQKLSDKVPLNLEFVNEEGKKVQLGDFLKSNKKPLVIAPGYYNCPRLCTLVYNQVRDAVSAADKYNLQPGRDYTIISLSFNEKEGPMEARLKAAVYRNSFKEVKVGPDGWQFLTGTKENISRLFTALGYKFRRDKGEFSHPAAIIIITPEGKIARYLEGLRIPGKDFRFALIEASNGRIGGLVDRAFQLCFRWDNETGQYTPVAWTFMRIGGIVTLLGIIGMVLFLIRLERKT